MLVTSKSCLHGYAIDNIYTLSMVMRIEFVIDRYNSYIVVSLKHRYLFNNY